MHDNQSFMAHGYWGHPVPRLTLVTLHIVEFTILTIKWINSLDDHTVFARNTADGVKSYSFLIFFIISPTCIVLFSSK